MRSGLKWTNDHVAWWYGFLLALTVQRQESRSQMCPSNATAAQWTTGQPPKFHCCQGHSVGKTGRHRVLTDRHLALLRLPAAMQAFSWRMWVGQRMATNDVSWGIWTIKQWISSTIYRITVLPQLCAHQYSWVPLSKPSSPRPEC